MITTTLEMTKPPGEADFRLPAGARIEQCLAPTTAYAKYLYSAVGSDWHWTDRLPWSDEQWASTLAAPGTEMWVLYSDGAPAGYVEFGAVPHADGSAVEIVYFGLLPHAIGKGFGKALLTKAISLGWTLPERHGMPPAGKVWLHTCSLDGPHALANYQARGFIPVGTTTHEQEL